MKRYKKPPVREITVIDTIDKVEIYFVYDSKIVELLHKIGGGRYRPFPQKHWEFAKIKKEQIIQNFRDNNYYVHISKKEHDVFNEPDVVTVLMNCKKCGRLDFCGREKLCPRCK